MRKPIGFMALVSLLFLGAAFITLRAAEQALVPIARPVAAAVVQSAKPGADQGGQATQSQAGGAATSHPPPSAPEESATIVDDPTVAPDPHESADNNVSFPTDI